MSNSHHVLVPRLIDECRKVGRPDMIVDVGGIIPQEDVQELLNAGVHRVFHTGTCMEMLVESVRIATRPHAPLTSMHPIAKLARNISMVHESQGATPIDAPKRRPKQVVGITGSPGAGKSTLVASMANEMHRRGEKLAVIAFDPMSPITGGALLGDRLRVDFNTVDEAVFYRSLAIVGEDYATLPAIIELIGGAGFDKLIIETVGAGQNDVAIRQHVDRCAVVLVPGMGDAIQMDKAGILEIADLFVVNKVDFPQGSKLMRELRDVAGKTRIHETVATLGKGVTGLLDDLFR
jgi:LAO/AO transport system ATPase